MSTGHRYDDIINLPHHQSVKHPHMSMTERAAQFSPFAALTGYEAVIAETGRLTGERIELNDEAKEEIDRILRELLDQAEEASFTYFVPDERKEGGKYETVRGIIQRYDMLEGLIILDNGRKIPVEMLRSVE